MRAVLDACVLFPTILREILCDLAADGRFTPLWSERILEEWRHVALRLGPDAGQIAGAEIALLRLGFPDAVQPHDGDRAIDLDFPDPTDRHVVEAALAGDAELIITANLRDFPQRMMAGIGLRAIHPDAFLLDLFRKDPDHVTKVIGAVCDKAVAMGGNMTPVQMLKRGQLPRMAKAVRS